MAITVIGGFSTSTVLTLIVVPLLFTYIYNVTQFLTKPFRAVQSRREELIPEPKIPTLPKI